MMGAVMVVAALIRIALIPRQGLWADEIFSLAIATGHSLEQPASQSRPEVGDYYENPQPRPASFYRAYLKNDGGATIARITRAVLLSDTNPPLYYLVLHCWTVALGTSDFSVRMFSLLWSLAPIPLILFIGRRIHSSKAGLIACLIFAMAPQAIYYSTEGRMYSLVWFLIAAYASAILALHDDGISWDRALAAILAGAAGLLTHYFFLFPWIACTLWTLIEPGRTPRWMAIIVGTATTLLVMPWYIHLPASLGAWRITGYWLYMRNTRWPRRMAISHLAWSFFSVEGTWGGSKRFDYLAMVCVVTIVAVACVRRPRAIMNRKSALLWLWMIAAMLAPSAFDVVRGTFTSVTDRYVLAGLPAAFILLALCLLEMPGRLGIAAGCVMLLFWTIGDRRIFVNRSRDSEPYREAALQINRESPGPDLLIVHSIPSGVLGIARYLDSQVPIFSWVGQLRVRSMPDDIARTTAGAREVILVKIHQVGEPAPEEEWLRSHARATQTRHDENADIVFFEMAPSQGAGGAAGDGPPIR